MNTQIFDITDDVDIYLHERPKKGEELGKPIFKNLADTYDKVSDGKLQGIKSLQLSLDKYAEKLADHPDFKELGKNKDERKQKLELSPNVKRFQTFDKNLNTFYVGMDSDYFIHKDLEKFLKTEQRRYIQNTILGDLDTLLNLKPENPAFAIARAFRNVTDEVIALLISVETFQMKLFLMKKKVLSTDYLISVGKIIEVTKNDKPLRRKLLECILKNDAQLDDWNDTFGIDIRDQLPLLEVHTTLPLDTKHFTKDEDFIDEILSLFDDLDMEIDGVLLNSENFQALDLLVEKYRRSIRCIHIDPPYNTNTSGFLYKNNYQHSSWLTMMDNRLFLAEQLMAPESCILCHIDENEYENLFHIFNSMHLQNQGTIVWDKRNPVFGAKKIVTQHESILCFSKGSIKLYSRSLNRKMILNEVEKLIRKYKRVNEKCIKDFKRWINSKVELSGGERAYNKIDNEGNVYRTASMSAPGKQKDEKYFCPLIHPDTLKPCPVPANGWSDIPETMQDLLSQNAIEFGIDETKQPEQKLFLKDYRFGELSSVLPSGERGKTMLDALGLKFDYSHPIGLYEEIVWSVTPDGKGVILDFFAGSGTNGHAVFNLNKSDRSKEHPDFVRSGQEKGNRKFILVEMGDYFNSILKERIRRVMFSENWKNGKPDRKSIDGTVGIVKYQRLEQYEDVLNNLTTTEQDDEQAELPVRYLYRPEEQEIRLMMDMREPFSNRITYGKDSTDGYVDVLETYCYMKGLSIQHRMRFDFGNQVYRVIRSDKRAVVFRNVTEGVDDTDALLEILSDERIKGVTRLDANYDVNQIRLHEVSSLKKIHIISTEDFDSGSVWDIIET